MRPAAELFVARFLCASDGGGRERDFDERGSYKAHLDGGVYGDRRIVPKVSVAEMQKRQSTEDKSLSYGLGWKRRRVTDDDRAVTLEHGGSTGALVWIDLERRLIGVLLVQMQKEQAREFRYGVRDRSLGLFLPE